MTFELVNDTRLDLHWFLSTGDQAPQQVATVQAGRRATVVYRPDPQTSVGASAHWTSNAECTGGTAFAAPSPGSYPVTARSPEGAGPSPACGGEREFTVIDPDGRG